MNENDEQELEKRKQANLARKAYDRSRTLKKNREQFLYDQKDHAEKIQFAIGIMLKQFIDEIKDGLHLVDYKDKALVVRRKDQLSIIKDTMLTLKQLKELAYLLEAEGDVSSSSNRQSSANVLLFDQANQLLKRKRQEAA